MFFADATTVASNFSLGITIALALTTLTLGALNIRNKYEKGNDADAIENLKSTNETYVSRRASDQVVIDSMKEQIALEKQKSTILESHVTQAPDINKLIVELGQQRKQQGKQHQELMMAIARVVDGNGTMITDIGTIAKALSNKDKQ